jgi:hypothetical protein
MSGFLPDLASWALGGGAGNGDAAADATEGGESTAAAATVDDAAPLTEREMRARRLARMDAMSSSASSSSAPAAAATEAPQAMEVDSPSAAVAAAAASKSMDISPPRKTRNSPTSKEPVVAESPAASTGEQPSQQSKKKAKEFHAGGTPTNNGNSDPAKKLQRKKEFLLKKILQITLTNGLNSTSASNSDPACVSMELDDPIPLGIHSIAELLATRLSFSLPQIATMPPQKPLMVYLANAHRKAGEELKMMRSSGSSSSKGDNAKKQAENSELTSLLEEVQRQVVSYAASSLMEPDLFEQAKDGVEQLTKALTNAGIDPSQDITFGVSGPSSSFYQMLCDELYSQDKTSFSNVLQTVLADLLKNLTSCESLDSGVGDTSALGIVSALTSVCSHKKAALVVTQLDSLFLLPAAGTPQAAEIIRPPVLPGADIMRMFAADNRPYQKRSGPGLEKETLLGLVLRISTPKSNPAFSPTNILRQSLDSVERATNQQRQQLRVYQEACHQLIMNLIKGGPDARSKVLAWFVDCLLVNPGATAMRPDATKVSSSSLLLNVSVTLLKLCDPFVQDAKKHHLIDPRFVFASEPGKLIFPTSGDNAISRLGEADSADAMATDSNAEYAPKNAFIPQVFFLAARSLALGIVPMLSSHENLLRHISHQHWELNSQNRDIHSDPHFCMLVSRQRSAEVSIFQEEMMTDTIRFINLMSRALVGLPDDVLRQMPEHFVDNICDILMSVAKLKAKLLRGMDARFVFSLMVKLLSPTYKSVSLRSYYFLDIKACTHSLLSFFLLPPDRWFETTTFEPCWVMSCLKSSFHHPRTIGEMFPQVWHAIP